MVNSSTMTLIVIVMAIYFIGMIAISWMGRKYGKNFDDFISAGRNCTTLMIIGFAVGSHIGNGYVVGGAASGAAVGLSGAWYGIGCALSYLVVALILNHRVYTRWRMTCAGSSRLSRSVRKSSMSLCSSLERRRMKHCGRLQRRRAELQWMQNSLDRRVRFERKSESSETLLKSSSNIFRFLAKRCAKSCQMILLPALCPLLADKDRGGAR